MQLQPFEDIIRQLIEIVPNATLVVDRRGDIIRVNSRVLSLFGYERNDLVGAPLATLVPERLRASYTERLLTFINGPTVRSLDAGLEIVAHRKDGSEFPAGIGLCSFEAQDGRRCFMSIADMTEYNRTLLQSRQIFEDAIRALGVSILMVDERQRIQLINGAAEKLFGFAEAELLDKPLDTLLPDRFRKAHAALAANFFTEWRSRTMANGREFPALRKNGEEVSVEIALTPLQTSDGPRVLAAIWDLRERKLAEEQIRSSEARMLSIYESLAQPVVLFDVEPGHHYRFVSVNSAFSKFVGLPKEAVVGHLMEEFFPEIDSSEVAKHLQECETTGGVVRWEETSELPSGRRSGIGTCSPIFDKHGACVQLVLSVLDVTAEQEAEIARKASERLLKTVFDTLPVHLVVKDTETRYLMVNPAWCERYGLTPEQVIGKKSMEIPGRPLKDREYTLAQDRTTLAADSGTVIFEGWDTTATGEIRHYQSIRAPLRNEQGTVTGLVGATVDLTELKRAEQKLHENEERLALIYEAVAEPLLLMTVEPGDRFRFASVNTAFAEFQSQPRNAIEGKFLEEVVPPAVAQAVGQHLRAARDSGKTERWEQVSNAPTGLRISMNACTPINDDKGICTHLVLSVHNTTAERLAEQKLHDSEERLALIYRSISEPIALIGWANDGGSRYVYVNPAWEAANGISSEQAVGRRVDEILPPDVVADVRQHIREAIHSRAPVRRERFIPRPQGARCQIATYSPVFDKEGRCTHIVASALDVTAECQADAARKESEARLAMIYEAMAEPTLLLKREGDGKLHVESANPAFAERTGWTLAQAIGRSIEELYTPEVCA